MIISIEDCRIYQKNDYLILNFTKPLKNYGLKKDFINDIIPIWLEINKLKNLLQMKLLSWSYSYLFNDFNCSQKDDINNKYHFVYNKTCAEIINPVVEFCTNFLSEIKNVEDIALKEYLVLRNSTLELYLVKTKPILEIIKNLNDELENLAVNDFFVKLGKQNGIIENYKELENGFIESIDYTKMLKSLNNDILDLNNIYSVIYESKIMNKYRNNLIK